MSWISVHESAQVWEATGILVMWADAPLRCRSLLVMDKAAETHLMMPYTDQLNTLQANVRAKKSMNESRWGNV